MQDTDRKSSRTSASRIRHPPFLPCCPRPVNGTSMALSMSSLATAAPSVTLRNAPVHAFDGAIAAARTCYSPRVLTADEVTDRQRDTIGALTFEAGHHTVYQHAHFEFGLENISRQLVWTVLHAYPFYNSEQSSQRYVKLKEPRAFVPPISGEALQVYERAVLTAWDAYAELSALLKDDAFGILKELRYVTPRVSAERLKGIEREAEKKAIETARYVIPIAAFTSMVHTISGITLHRLRRMCGGGRHAARSVARDRPDGGSRPRDRSALLREGRLRGAVTVRPARSGLPAPARRRRRVRARVRRAARGPGLEAGRQLATRAARHRRGGARHLRPDPRRDARRGGHRSRAEPRAQPVPPRRDERVVPLADDAGAAPRLVHLREAPQPHRRFTGPAPSDGPGVAAAHDVCRHGRARLRRARGSSPATRRRWTVYERAMHESWRAKNRLLELGVPLEFALYVLPNAKTLRMVESGAAHRAASTSGRCAPASTRRRRSTWRRWTKWRRCARRTRSSRATSARRASCATASSRRAARKAPTSAASPCGAASRTSSGASEPMRHAGLRASGSRLRALQEHAPVACPRARVTSAEAARV